MWIEICTASKSSIEIMVIPHVGMWIEIMQITSLWCRALSHPSRRDVDWNKTKNHEKEGRWVIPHVGMWIEILLCIVIIPQPKGHPSRRDVDWNLYFCKILHSRVGHPSRRDVDWNYFLVSISIFCHVIPHVGMWIEIRCRLRGQLRNFRHPSRRDVDWNITKWRKIKMQILSSLT